VQPCTSPNENEFPGFSSASHKTPKGPSPQMSQKKVAAMVKLERPIRWRRVVERLGKCIVAFGLSAGMLEPLAVRLEV
jgi:hypothetical protein